MSVLLEKYVELRKLDFLQRSFLPSSIGGVEGHNRCEPSVRTPSVVFEDFEIASAERVARMAALEARYHDESEYSDVSLTVEA